MILGVQLLGILFGLGMLYITFLHYKRKEFTLNESGFWIILWLIFIIVALVPSILDPIVKSLSIARTMDLFIVVGFLFLIAAVYYTYGIVRQNQKKIEKVVREVAIKRK